MARPRRAFFVPALRTAKGRARLASTTLRSAHGAPARPAGARYDLDLEQAAEAFLRVTVSFALIPDTALPLDDDDAGREVARRPLVPTVAG
jgi:hypothetical protein